MKKVIIFCLAITHFGCDLTTQNAANNPEEYAAQAPKIVFEKGAVGFDFGEIKEDTIVQHKFNFKNEGEFPLIINNITASCGCTTPEWPHEPIESGESGTILVKFNSKGKSGPQNKTVSIYANTYPPTTQLNFTAVVEPKPDSTKTK